MLLLEKPGQLSNPTPTALSHPSPSLSFSYLSFSLVYILSRLKTYKRVSRKDSSKKKMELTQTASWVSLMAQLVKNLPAMQDTWVRSLGWKDPMEKGKSTYSSILASRFPWTV